MAEEFRHAVIPGGRPDLLREYGEPRFYGVWTGSFNFTHQAESENAENLLILKGHADLIQRYRDNFFHHKAHCKPAQIREGEAKNRRAA